MSGSSGAKLRWKLVDENPQQSLFDDEELMDRHVGRGEFAGMEFLHVNAKRVINQVPAASHLPFQWTINAYRGCSHACSYCCTGDMPVLMADGTERKLAELRAGDAVYGTEVAGRERHLVPTTVLAHWSTTKRAWRVVLEDGRELVASGEHRFLTTRGWAHVASCSSEAGMPASALQECESPALGVTDLVVAADGRAVGVVAISDLGHELPMFDVTTGTGDFVANGVVSHNCFARPTHDYLGLGIGEDFERKIVVKVNAVERVRAEVSSPKWQGEHIAMGTNTDPYQRCEGKYHLTRGIVAVLGQARNPFSILTKSTLILRDLDLLTDAAARTDVKTSFSIGSLDEEVWKLAEPGTPHPRRRIEAVARLNEAGIPCGVLIAPILPGLSDHPDQLKEVAEACVEAGAASISALPLHLRRGVREHYLEWLAGTRPELVDTYERRYAGRAYLPKAEQEAVTSLVRGFVEQARRRSGSADSAPAPAKMAPGGTNGQNRRPS